MKRSKGLKRGAPARKLRTRSAIQKTNHGIFKDAAGRQIVCAGCGSADKPWQPHHVVFEKHLKDRGLPRYDARNALRLCCGPLSCHAQHHGPEKLPTRKLRDENVDYAFLVLGAYAIDYLRRYYDDSDPDPRIAEREAAQA